MEKKDQKKYSIVPKSDDHGKWYQSILLVSDMIDYSEVGGCYVLKPLSMKIWENIKTDLNSSIEKLGIENYYFPLFATKTNLQREADHFDDFVPEVAWVDTNDTHNSIQSMIDSNEDLKNALNILKSHNIEYGLRTPNMERYAIRPTSETIIYPHFSEWIKKTGTYPKINQWANVVRWETKSTQPFIRSREFLWQEGHTCFKTKEEAINEVFKVLEIYKNLYERLLAVPMIDGYKTKSETFPGAELTTTIEGFLPDSGKGIQSATSHYLGQKFSKMFDIKNNDGELVHQNSWGLTTRSIGIMIMTHSDERGIVLPPNIAPIQVVIIACGITVKTTHEMKHSIYEFIEKLTHDFNQDGIRTIFDNGPDTPGMKFNKWETQGVPLRLEFGPKNMSEGTMTFVRRDNEKGLRETINLEDVNATFMKNYLANIHEDMLGKAKRKIRDAIIYCTGPDKDHDIIMALKNKHLVLVDWNDDNDDGKYEIQLKDMCQRNDINSTKILCIPNNETLENLGINIDRSSNRKYALFGKSY